MQKRLLLALALLSCNAPAFAEIVRTSNDTVCVPHQDEDCDASSGSSMPTASTRMTPSQPPSSNNTMPRVTPAQRRNRTDAVRNSTMRFQSYLPGMFR